MCQLQRSTSGRRRRLSHSANEHNLSTVSHLADVLDTNRNCTAAAYCLAEQGVRSVFRYYSEHTRQPEKRLTPKEAAVLGSAGLRVGVVYQDGGRDENDFTREKGERAG